MNQNESYLMIRVFLDETRKFEGKPVYQALVKYLHDNKYAGVTVLRGVEGYGHSGHIHTTDIVDLSTSLPIVIEIIDTADRIETLKSDEKVKNMLRETLVTQEKVTVINS